MSNVRKIASKTALIAGSLPFFFGCADYSYAINPELPSDEGRRVFIPCHIIYEGDKTYLPSALRENNATKCKAAYSYSIRDISAQEEESSLWDYVNPLNLFRVFEDEQYISAEGNLTLDDGFGGPKTFTSTCTAAKSFSVDPFGDLLQPEQSCLESLRDNIDTQLVRYKQNR